MEYVPIVSVEDYLRVEEAARERSEYVAGRMFAMAGATYAHNLIVSNLGAELRRSALPSGCVVLFNNMKLHVVSQKSFYYPDLMVTCERTERDALTIVSPRLVVEVLSPSTESTDRREKLAAYATVPSIMEYLIVSQNERLIEVNRMDADRQWHLNSVAGNGVISLFSFGDSETRIKLDDVYYGLD